MKRVMVGIFLAASFSAPGLAAGQSPDAQPASTLQANSNLVVVDVVVADSHHNPVHKLTKADFTVLEDGKPQAVKSFEEHTSADAPAPLPPLPRLPPGMFTNYTAVAASGALNVLLLDSLNTPTLDKTRLREQVLDFLNEVKPGTRIAIFGITTQLLFLQGFTSDPAVLRAVLSSKKGAPKPSPLTDKAVSGNNLGAEDDVMDWLHDNALSLSAAAETPWPPTRSWTTCCSWTPRQSPMKYRLAYITRSTPSTSSPAISAICPAAKMSSGSPALFPFTSLPIPISPIPF